MEKALRGFSERAYVHLKTLKVFLTRHGPPTVSKTSVSTEHTWKIDREISFALFLANPAPDPPAFSVKGFSLRSGGPPHPGALDSANGQARCPAMGGICFYRIASACLVFLHKMVAR